MKPISTLANHRTLARHESRELRTRPATPRTDHAFREPADTSTVATPPAKRQARSGLSAFRQLSQDLLAREERRNYVIEMVVFGLVIALIIWALASTLILLAQTASG
jgi:hypothetical protein